MACSWCHIRSSSGCHKKSIEKGQAVEPWPVVFVFYYIYLMINNHIFGCFWICIIIEVEVIHLKLSCFLFYVFCIII